MAEHAKYVTLGAADNVFAVPVDHVQQILENQPVTAMPEARADFSGLIDLRGRTVPVMDLRTRLGLHAAADTPATRIVVMDVKVGAMTRWIGLKADRVFEVTHLDDGATEQAEDMGAAWQDISVMAVGRRNGTFVSVLDLDRLFARSDVPHAAIAAA